VQHQIADTVVAVNDGAGFVIVIVFLQPLGDLVDFRQLPGF
jgi:hypothetical protein